MSTISIKVQGFNEFVSNLSNAKSMFQPLAKTALNKSAIQIEKRAKDNVTVAEGKLKASITHDVKGLTATVWAGKEYGVYVEEGTRPHFPPITPLKKWAAIKLGDSSLAYVVARKIAAEGTKAQPFMKPAAIESERDIERNFEELASQLVSIMAK